MLRRVKQNQKKLSIKEKIMVIKQRESEEKLQRELAKIYCVGKT